MSKYSITATKQDYEKIYNDLSSIEETFSLKLKWDKLKRLTYDQLITFQNSLQKSLMPIMPH